MKENLGTALLNHKSFKLSALALVIAATLPVKSLHAEEIKELATSVASAEVEADYKIDNSTSHKYTKPLVDTPKTITIISEAAMKDRNVDSLRDALRNVSGISMAAGEGGAPTGDSMSIRGFSATSDIFVDGIRDIAGYNRDMYNVEAVEVAKGPGSAVSGRGSTGGSINLVTKTAKLDDFNDISVRVGSENDYRAQLDSNTKLSEESALRVNVMANDGDVAGRDHVENSNKAIAVSFVTGLATQSRFTFNADYQKQDNIPDYGIPWVYSDTPVAELVDSARGPSPVDFSNFYGNLYRDFEDIEAMSATARYEYDLSPETMIRAQARIGSVERQSITTAPRYIDITTSTDIKMSDEKTRDTENSLAALQVDLIGEYNISGYTHNVVTGVEFAKENYKRRGFVALVPDNLNDVPVLNDLYNPNPYLPYTGQYGRDGTSIESKGTTIALYAFDTMTLNEQWDITGGLRYDNFKVDYQNDYNDPSAEIGNTDNFVSWNVATVYKPTANSSIYFGAGNSFNPSAEGLTLSDSTKVLDPEETRSYELGAKWSLFDNALLTNVALFKTIKDNARVRASRNDPYEITGEQQVQGLELSATGQLSEDFLLIASYTYQDSEVLDDVDSSSIGNELARTPKHSASLWGKYEINEKLSAGIGAQYMGERYNGTSSTRSTAPDYTIFDLMVSYQVTNKLSLQLNGENLTDKAYVDQLGGGHYVPGNGRYFSLTGNYSF